jgi:hypothetical protein
MLDDTAPSRRTDNQLLSIMDETADWVVRGRGGKALGLRHSLREALRAVFGYESASQPVFAVCGPGDTIVIFREQMTRVAGADGVLAQESAACRTISSHQSWRPCAE